MNRDKEIQQAAIKDCELYANNRGLYSFIAGAKWADEHPITRWISVKEKAPNSYKAVVIGDESNGFIGLGFCVDKQWYYCSGYAFVSANYVTHWMPIPDLKTDKK